MIVVRHDLQNGQRVSYRKGCEAIISHDNGLTWDLSRKYILDEGSSTIAFFPVMDKPGTSLHGAWLNPDAPQQLPLDGHPLFAGAHKLRVSHPRLIDRIDPCDVVH